MVKAIAIKEVVQVTLAGMPDPSCSRRSASSWPAGGAGPRRGGGSRRLEAYRGEVEDAAARAGWGSKRMRNWAAEEIRARGFDPATGRTSPNLRKIQPRASSNPGLSASARSYLKPEQLLQIAVVEALRPRLVDGAKLRATNGELPGGSKLFRLWQTVRRAMGYEPGGEDLEALYRGRAYFIELKRGRGEPDLLGHRKARGELSAVQRTRRAWAEAQGFPTAVCRSVDEVEAALKGWGLIAG